MNPVDPDIEICTQPMNFCLPDPDFTDWSWFFLRQTEHEYRQLLLRLGYDKSTADLKAFLLTGQVAVRIKELRKLVNESQL